MTAIAYGWPRAVRRVPSSGSTATSTSGPPPAPTRSPLNSIGASSFSPSPITTTPSIATVSSMARIASTAAWSAAILSPRPIHRPAPIAAASVTRTRSRARLRPWRVLVRVGCSTARATGRILLGHAPQEAHEHGVRVLLVRRIEEVPAVVGAVELDELRGRSRGGAKKRACALLVEVGVLPRAHDQHRDMNVRHRSERIQPRVWQLELARERRDSAYLLAELGRRRQRGDATVGRADDRNLLRAAVLQLVDSAADVGDRPAPTAVGTALRETERAQIDQHDAKALPRELRTVRLP